jgi:hypothetical protein
MATLNLTKRRNIMKYSKLMAALVLIALSSIAAAQMNNQPGGNNGQGSEQGGAQGGQGMGSSGGERPHGPPPQAIAACNGLASGATCNFQGHENKTVSGTCFAPPGNNHPLACKPEGGGQNGGGQNMGGHQPSGQGGNQHGRPGGNN